ncbi:MAG: hypothetical protein R6V43_06220 [Halopseudomonas sp.]
MAMAIQRGRLVAKARMLYQIGAGLISLEESEPWKKTKKKQQAISRFPTRLLRSSIHFCAALTPEGASR